MASRIEVGQDFLGAKISLSQRAQKEIGQRMGNFSGRPNSKEEKAQARKKGTFEELLRRQFERGLQHMLDGTATPEDIRYVLGHIGKFETADRSFPAEPNIAITTINTNGKGAQKP